LPRALPPFRLRILRVRGNVSSPTASTSASRASRMRCSRAKRLPDAIDAECAGLAER
jgi:hypothetical protein